MPNRFENLTTGDTTPSGAEDAKRAARGEDEEKRLNVRVSADLYDAFRSQCDDEGRSMAWVVRRFLEHYAEHGADGTDTV
jgi:hypothetical protein